MSRSEKGIVLLSTMLIITIMTLLVLSMMQSVLLYMKASNQQIHQHQVFYEMEDAINRLDFASPNCVVHNQSAEQSIDQLVLNQGCTHEEKPRKYSYVLNELSPTPCLQIKTQNGMQGSHHWLITIATAELPHVVLQIRVAKPAETDPCPLNRVHRIHAGVLSWRKVYVSK